MVTSMNTVLLNSKLVPKSNIMLRPQEFMMKTNNNYNKIGQDKVLKIEVNQHQKMSSYGMYIAAQLPMKKFPIDLETQLLL